MTDLENGRGGIGIIGAGRLGQALGRALRLAGAPVAAIASRNADHAAAGARFIGGETRAVEIEAAHEAASTIVLTVSDEAISGVAERLAAGGMHDGVVLHTCGGMGPEALVPLGGRGVNCGVMHPMQTIPSPEAGVGALRGICWGVTAEGEALARVEEIVSALAGKLLPIDSGARAAYHAAAVVACNYFTAGQDAALHIMESAGVDRGTATRALGPMVEATWRNIQEAGPVEALTGPIVRGDVETVRRHLKAIGHLPETVRNFYRAAGLHTVEIARTRGLEKTIAGQLEQILRDNGI